MKKIKAALSTSAIPYWMSQFIWVIWRANRKTAVNNKTVKHSFCLWIQTQPSDSLPWLMEWRSCSHIGWQSLPVINIVFWIHNMPSWKRSVALGMATIHPSNKLRYSCLSSQSISCQPTRTHSRCTSAREVCEQTGLSGVFSPFLTRNAAWERVPALSHVRQALFSAGQRQGPPVCGR